VIGFVVVVVVPSPQFQMYAVIGAELELVLASKKKSSPTTKHVTHGVHVNAAIGGLDARALLGSPTARTEARASAIRSVAEIALPLLIF
jgi:hypothetical protein